ncbi:PLAC8 family [Novymonas esmeraldas]|uniref:PLAC8 family n=1 Tax=Novymonas esmeraldas TaxID=1808958 RepID=A0AAW0EKR8_9TRYP
MFNPPKQEYQQVRQGEQQPNVQDEVPLTAVHPLSSVVRPWHYDLCVMCGEMNSCLECCFCGICQMSRQYNMFYNHTADLHLPVCLVLWFLGNAGVPATFALEFVLRADIRRRYGIEGSVARDCCVSWCCTPCAVQQQFLEMTSLGMCPGMSMCGVTPIVPEEPTMV